MPPFLCSFKLLDTPAGSVEVKQTSGTWKASSNSSTRFPLLLVGVAIAETGGEASFMGVIGPQQCD
ncbi:unnamed protein product [Acanthoscelides obtectus]|uniref:Uncharacterized protein n=1 Tax=Acanthoscelides obtectus TaxID=200917 RepID=A0A9P0NXV8_ACAOB|nr:unnamed protein product [Acanthoscelides obtectus]CAK1678985.1 hypothetical protein AOBTE_LOCUS32083 [Acanthoscelides obtectus]